MANRDNKEAAGILRGIKSRIEELEGQISTSEGVPNLLRSVFDRSTTGDSVSTSTGPTESMTWDDDDWDKSEWQ